MNLTINRKDNYKLRINKFISEAGKASRREADRLIQEGRVTINGKVAVLGDQVQPSDDVRLNKEQLQVVEELVYIAFNKPVGITCTSAKNVEGNIIDYIGHPLKINHVGRLDKDSKGLILLTNDGDIINRILRAEYNHEKEYIVSVDKPITGYFLKQMAAGVEILDTKTLPCKITQLSKYRFQIILTQGLNRQIRRMCETLGYQVKTLERIRIMNINLGKLPIGRWRDLTKKEKKVLFEDLNYKPKEWQDKNFQD
jgi:23S rRNA pseudouridine2604 synthase